MVTYLLIYRPYPGDLFWVLLFILVWSQCFTSTPITFGTVYYPRVVYKQLTYGPPLEWSLRDRRRDP